MSELRNLYFFIISYKRMVFFSHKVKFISEEECLLYSPSSSLVACKSSTNWSVLSYAFHHFAVSSTIGPSMAIRCLVYLPLSLPTNLQQICRVGKSALRQVQVIL